MTRRRRFAPGVDALEARVALSDVPADVYVGPADPMAPVPASPMPSIPPPPTTEEMLIQAAKDAAVKAALDKALGPVYTAADALADGVVLLDNLYRTLKD